MTRAEANAVEYARAAFLAIQTRANEPPVNPSVILLAQEGIDSLDLLKVDA